MATRGTEQEEWQPAPHERSPMPGSPPTPWHPPARRIAYGAVGALVVMAGALGNGIVTANLLNLQGSLGLYQAEIQWLPTVYVMTNVCANMLLIKFRQQFGIRLFAQMTAIENVMVGRHLRTHAGALGAVLRGAGTRAEEEADAARHAEALHRGVR